MAQKEIPKAYEAAGVENKIYSAWERSGYFNPDQLPGKRKETFSIVLPPPNVTGLLHLGHATMLAIEDIMVRFARMSGKKALWLPGTDHAAIATQAKVEKVLYKEEGKTRHDLGREEFLKRVAKFAQASHDGIVERIKLMGASVDWGREAFTLDEARTKAVRTAFKMMHADGLIYRGERVINWCPRCSSTLSDDELEYQEGEAKLYTFRYDKDFPIAISTTRPETKLGDTAVAVNPKDGRYKKFVGKTYAVNFLGQNLSIKVVADLAADPAFGTGAVGITPAHSKADAEIAARQELPALTIIDEEGKMTKQAGKGFAGLAVLAAREKVVAGLRQAGLIEKEETVPQSLSTCYRCGTSVEPLPKLQWFIDVNKPFAFRQSKNNPIKGLRNGQKVSLKEIMIHTVKSGQIKIIPERFNKTYFHWITNLRDWNVSRQIWYGHQVPVWYKNEQISVGEEPKGAGWRQDPDTLDTWFSSGLWTISTLGWPERTNDLKLYHPTTVMETGYDILFFWVARMILMTTYAVGEVPFKTVYLHGLVRDEQGRKMSKSLDNVIDPMEMVAKFGADATRLALVLGSAPGNDFRLSAEKIAGFRNFTNKLWNISRFVLMSVDEIKVVNKVKPATLADRWILSRFGQVQKQVTDHLAKHELSAAGELLRDFTWSEFADWYLEIAKLQKGQDKLKQSTEDILLFLLRRLLTMWHPFMPFVTEEIWQAWGEKEPLIIQAWPQDKIKTDKKAEKEFAFVQEVIGAIRNIRSQHKIEPARQDLTANIAGKGEKIAAREMETICRLARLTELQVGKTIKEKDAASAVVGESTITMSLAQAVDLNKEKERLNKEMAETQTYLDCLGVKLANREFTKKAPERVVQEMMGKQAEAKEKLAAIKQQLESLS